MEKLVGFLNKIFSSDKNIIITALVIVFGITALGLTFGKMVTSLIAFILVVIAIIVIPVVLKGSYKKFKNKDK